MDNIDLILKNYLEEKRRTQLGARPVPDFPATKDFYRFLTGGLKGQALEKFLEHLKSSPEDQDLVRQARELLEASPQESSTTQVPEELVQRAQGLMPPGQAPRRPRAGRWRYAWLIGAISAFLISFIVPRYFLQFSTLTIVLAAKWIVEERQAKTRILVYQALGKETQSADSNDWRK